MFFQKSRINICVIQKILVPLHPLKKKHRGVEQLVARQAHNLEVARSNPASATKEGKCKLTGLHLFFALSRKINPIAKPPILTIGFLWFINRSLLHFVHNLPIILVCCSNAVFKTSIPGADSFLDAIFWVMILLN